MVYAFDKNNNDVPMKTIKITNNTSFTVYPILRDHNEAVRPTNNLQGLYDPFDTVKS